MKVRFLIIVLFLSIIFGCEKDDASNSESRCIKKETTFYENNQESTWVKYIYTNGFNTKIETSSGSYILYEYDNNGNVTRRTDRFESGSEYVEIYEYDNMNNLTRGEYYTSGTLQNYTIMTYLNDLLQTVYNFNSSNDTAYWKKYSYQNEVLSHIETINSDSYFYYSSDIDSIITIDKNFGLSSKTYLKYSNDKKIYESKYYYLDNKIIRSEISTWEYLGELLVKENFDDEVTYMDKRYSYSNNLLKRMDSFLKSGIIDTYELYKYDENEQLVRIDYYDNYDNLESYKIIENTCI